MAKILVLGGYGVFGGRLVGRLVQETDAEILVAGRSIGKARAHCGRRGGTPLQLDRDADLTAIFAELRPTIVIDAAGPFQAYGEDPYRVARAAVATGAHYLDLADDGLFVAGIDALDDAAKAAGVAVISGASSVPTISSAALDRLTEGMISVGPVYSAILPGNRAPRGLSVVQAIVGQAGRPVAALRGGRWEDIAAWGRVSRRDLVVDGAAPLRGRLASPIGAPDLLLFRDRYGARTVSFEAGLELKILHLGLWALALPVRWRWLKSLSPLAPALKWMADRLERFGSDRGGMIARAAGRDQDGNAVERTWTLIAESGDGPEIPPTPALLLAKRLLAADGPAPGARPAVGVLSLAEIEAGLAGFVFRFGMDERPATPLLEQVLSRDLACLPVEWRRLAEIYDCDTFAGEASVERGKGLLSRLAGWTFGFPAETRKVAVEVFKEKTARGERWTRRFDGKPFVSHLSRKPDYPPGRLTERFGPFSFRLQLSTTDGRVTWPVESWCFLGIPMPKALMPRSETAEYVEDGRFRFDVGISLPLAGLVVRYRGWLAPVSGT
ncbi:DUF4166 domain-containing protein [Mesorhizobium sp. IMUNJ 23232]|uniref:SDR family oxidoreductase n=1 Tax=Mesorhizobium sp. IMUNJ 23232 TaxID=3376064 RepID=UPI0037A05F36